jgi:TrmH family RNA methyltransferase
MRKAERIFAAAEQHLVTERQSAPGRFPADYPAYLAELLALLAADGEFSPPERRVFKEAARDCLPSVAALPGDPSPAEVNFRRALNAARHVLLSNTGRYPADWDLLDGGGLDGAGRRVFPGMWVYLEDIRSPFNVGAMFRAAESFGVEELRLSPLCADPRHRRALRTAMGCVDILPWERAELREVLGSRGTVKGENEPGPQQTAEGKGPLPCFALETGGVDIADFPFPLGGILIAGSEELGVSPAALERADASLGRLSIRTWGAKGSLNVSVAFGIALQRWAEVLAGS